MAKRISESQRKSICHDHTVKGKSVNAIAMQRGLAWNTVRDIIKNCEGSVRVNSPNKPKVKLTDAERKAIKDDLAAGMSLRAAADKHGRSHRTVGRLAAELQGNYRDNSEEYRNAQRNAKRKAQRKELVNAAGGDFDLSDNDNDATDLAVRIAKLEAALDHAKQLIALTMQTLNQIR